MKNLFLTLIVLEVSLSALGGGVLLPWDHATCFRNSTDTCEEGTTKAYTTGQTEAKASPCGCIKKEDLLSQDPQQCDTLDEKSCKQNEGEFFYNLYLAKNRKTRIGCGCFIVEVWSL